MEHDDTVDEVGVLYSTVMVREAFGSLAQKLFSETGEVCTQKEEVLLGHKLLRKQKLVDGFKGVAISWLPDLLTAFPVALVK